MPNPDTADTTHTALLELNSTLREVIDAVRRSTAPEDALSQATVHLRDAARLLAPHAHAGPHFQGALGGDRPADPQVMRDPVRAFPYSPVIGRWNPIAPPIEFRVEAGRIECSHVFGATHAGPPGAVHGGVVAMVFDEMLGSVNIVNDVGAYTGTLTIRYHIPTPLGTPIRMQARVRETKGRKVFSEGKMWHGGMLTAEAEGIFIRP